MKKKKILLPEKKYEKAPSEDLSFLTNLEEKKSILTNTERDVILDTNELFNQERNDSIKYKIYGKVKMVFRNVYNGTSDYQYLAKKLSLEGDGTNGKFNGYLPYNEFAFLRNDIIREESNFYPVTSLSGFTGLDVLNVGIETPAHINITETTAPYYNWNFYLSYVYAQDSTQRMMYTLSGDTEPLSFIAENGIPFRIIENGNSYKLTSPVNHGMSVGEYIILDNVAYYINSVGDENYNSQYYTVNILKSQIFSGTTTFNNIMTTGKRCLDNKNLSGTTSQYYVHKHKTLSSVDDYIIDKIGFESNIFRDERKVILENISGDTDIIVERNRMETIIFDFIEPFVLSGITNNFGYTPTEIYLSAIFRNGNGYFDYPPKVGYKFNFHDTWADQYFDGETSKDTAISGYTFTKTEGLNTFSFISGNTLPVGTELLGAFIEFNPMELKERTISETYHKISQPIVENLNIFDYEQDNPEYYSGASISNLTGIFYQNHFKIKLRELSPYVETSNSPDIDNLPQNAKYYPDEKLWKWRDLYDHGYIDDLGYGVEHPFINDMHYVKSDINFYLKNERLFTNKTDGVAGFDTKINC